MEKIDYIIITIYLIFIVIGGVILQKKASTGIDSYFLGNRSLPWWVLGASGMTSNTDIAGTMIITALVYALGTKGLFIEIRGGVGLYLAFLMTFMGKWNRRSEVMTVAEWMKLRFGSGKEGNIARIISAVANIVFAIGSIIYFAVGGGKFLGQFLGINDKLAGILLILFALIYTTLSGFYGVVFTDIFQGIFIFIAILYICFLAMTTVNLPDNFVISLPGTTQVQQWNLSEWSSIIPPTKLDLPGDYAIFNLFAGAILFYLFKVFLQGAAGGDGYAVQRYFAAKSEQEVGLLSLFWIFLLSFRYPLVTALAILGIDYGLKYQLIADPELVLPTVIAEYIPTGIKGLLIACFIAAGMSTFDSIINASAAYWVKDIYQAYIQPEAGNQQLVNQGRLASIVIVGLGLIFSFYVNNINDIWSWLTLGLGSGLFIPLVLRWYWWRFNGYGFAIGTGVGLVVAIVTKAVILPLVNVPQFQEYILFLVPSICSFLGCILGTFLTKPTDLEVISNFYRVTRPFGFWGVVSQNFTNNLQAKTLTENKRDIIATFIAVPWQFVLFLLEMLLVMKQWHNFGVLLLVFILLSIGLYFTCFRYWKN